jgi:hypothetical protein
MGQTGIKFIRYKKGGLIFMATIFIMIGLLSNSVQAEINNLLELAISLFEENNFQTCRIECLRILSDNPLNKRAQFFLALSERRIGIDSTETLTNLCLDDTSPLQIKDMACYELSRAYIDKKKFRQAFDLLVQLFMNTKLPLLFVRSSCSLSHLFDHDEQLAANNPELYSQVDSCFSLWSDEIIEETSLIAQQNSVSWSGLPAQWVIRFYQTQIGPAIGQRCSLHPSCSRYAQQALTKFGILGIGFIGDRMIREPDVVAQKLKPVIIEGRVKYLDPLEDHDFINNYQLSTQ